MTQMKSNIFSQQNSVGHSYNFIFNSYQFLLPFSGIAKIEFPKMHFPFPINHLALSPQAYAPHHLRVDLIFDPPPTQPFTLELPHQPPHSHKLITWLKPIYNYQVTLVCYQPFLVTDPLPHFNPQLHLQPYLSRTPLLIRVSSPKPPWLGVALYYHDTKQALTLEQQQLFYQWILCPYQDQSRPPLHHPREIWRGDQLVAFEQHHRIYQPQPLKPIQGFLKPLDLKLRIQLNLPLGQDSMPRFWILFPEKQIIST